MEDTVIQRGHGCAQVEILSLWKRRGGGKTILVLGTSVLVHQTRRERMPPVASNVTMEYKPQQERQNPFKGLSLLKRTDQARTGAMSRL